MSDGLFHEDPPYRPRSPFPGPKGRASPVSPSDDGSDGNIAPVQPTKVVSNEGAGEEVLGSLPVSDVAALQSSTDHAQKVSVNESSWLGGLAEEQPVHHPATTAAARPSEPVPADYVPASQTEAPWSFRVIGRLYSALTGPTAIALVVAFGGLLSLYIYFQVVSLLATLGTLPTWLASIAVILLSLIIAVVVLAFGRLAVAYGRLRRNEQVRMSDIEQLHRHAQIRRGCSQSQQRHQAKAVLEEYVGDFPIPEAKKPPHHHAPSDTPSGPQEASPFFAEQLTQLRSVKKRLADTNRVKDSTQWLQIYATEFQSVLDAAANARVHDCAKWVGLKTAISPNSLVDTLIAAYWCFVLLRDLCLIYNVRVGAYGTAALLWRVFFTAYLAGKFHDWEDHTDYTIESMMDGLPEIGRKLVGKLAAKAGTGLANYFMVRRLGRRAIALLRPLSG